VEVCEPVTKLHCGSCVGLYVKIIVNQWPPYFVCLAIVRLFIYGRFDIDRVARPAFRILCGKEETGKIASSQWTRCANKGAGLQI
jgi:hypothetical protein